MMTDHDLELNYIELLQLVSYSLSSVQLTQ